MKTPILACSLLLVTTPLAALAQGTFTKVTTGPIATDEGTFGSASWGDFRNHGLLDLLVCDYAGGASVFYRNNGDGTFDKITQGDLVQAATYQVAPAAADFDNDGYLDLLVSAGTGSPTAQPNLLYHNNGDGSFASVGGGGVTNVTGFFNACTVADYDNDGFVDLFIPGASTTSLLFHNEGDGTFTQILSGSLVTDIVENHSVSCADYDNDGFLDLLINDSGGNRLYHNNGNGTFTQILTNEVATDSWSNLPWGSAWGDYDNDGLLDLFVTGMEMGNRLYHNNGNSAFTNITSGPMLPPPPGGGSRACAWGDYDNDGYLDLFVCGYNANNRLFHNNADGTFTEILSGSPVDEEGSNIYSHSCGWADYDNDGFLDLFVARATAVSNLLYHNQGNTNAWLKVKLVGTASNRSAIGAKVRVHAAIARKTFWQLREVSSGGGRWIQPLVAHFGLGDATNIDTVRIEWPSGTVQEFQNVAAKQILTITEPPRLLATTTNGVPQFSLKGGRGFQYEIDSSTNLSAWSSIGVLTITNLNGRTPIVDTNPPTSDRRFYRAVSR